MLLKLAKIYQVRSNTNYNKCSKIGGFMKVEFRVNECINDGLQIFIQESEFKKAKNNEEEYSSFAFATNCLFAYYGYPNDFINQIEYEKILSKLDKGGAVIITIVQERYPRNIYPEIFVSNNNKIKKIEL